MVAVSEGAVARKGTPVSRSKGKGNVRSARSVNAEAERREHGQAVLDSYMHDKVSSGQAKVDKTAAVDGVEEIGARQADTTHQRQLALDSFLSS